MQERIRCVVGRIHKDRKELQRIGKNIGAVHGEINAVKKQLEVLNGKQVNGKQANGNGKEGRNGGKGDVDKKSESRENMNNSGDSEKNADSRRPSEVTEVDSSPRAAAAAKRRRK
jgi:hypothetical protein